MHGKMACSIVQLCASTVARRFRIEDGGCNVYVKKYAYAYLDSKFEKRDRYAMSVTRTHLRILFGHPFPVWLFHPHTQRFCDHLASRCKNICLASAMSSSRARYTAQLDQVQLAAPLLGLFLWEQLIRWYFLCWHHCQAWWCHTLSKGRQCGCMLHDLMAATASNVWRVLRCAPPFLTEQMRPTVGTRYVSGSHMFVSLKSENTPIGDLSLRAAVR